MVRYNYATRFARCGGFSTRVYKYSGIFHFKLELLIERIYHHKMRVVLLLLVVLVIAQVRECHPVFRTIYME